MHQRKSKRLSLENDRKHDVNILEISQKLKHRYLEKIYNAVPKMIGRKFVYAYVYGKVPGAAGNKNLPGAL